MKVLDRLSLIDRVGRELQSRMSFGEIARYLKAHGVDTGKATSGINSKWVYSKELLADEKEALILRIADELRVPHNYTVAGVDKTVEATFWEPAHFRLFLSHVSSFKKNTGLLQAALRRYGISAFVAHVDIEPTKEWLDEIEAGLYSMDALAALLMPGFKESNWTDQEVGVAVGRDVLIIPVIKGVIPYGFISKYQGLHADGKSVATVAHEIFSILSVAPKTRSRMLSCLVETTLQSLTEAEALDKLEHLAGVKDLPRAQLENLRGKAHSSVALSASEPLARLNELLNAHSLETVAVTDAAQVVSDNEIPF